MDRANFVPARKMEINDLLAALGLVAAEAGICLVPATVQRMRTTDVCYRPLGEDGATSSISLSVLRGSTSPIVRQAKDILKLPGRSNCADHPRDVRDLPSDRRPRRNRCPAPPLPCRGQAALQLRAGAMDYRRAFPVNGPRLGRYPPNCA